MTQLYESNSSPAKVAVIMGYFQGKKYLHEQVLSIMNQTGVDLSLFIFDDCSPSPLKASDLSLNLKTGSRVKIIRRDKNLGFQMNFLKGLAEVPCEFDYYAFSDQDDVWYVNKLNRAVKKLSPISSLQPALYGARTVAWNETLSLNEGPSPLFTKPPSFGNALVQSIAGANTMVVNKAGRELIAEANYNTVPVSHDWWCYLLISGAGGEVIYDKNQSLKYRQHANNLVGSNHSWYARISRIKRLFRGHFRDWNTQNIEALEQNTASLKPESLKVLREFKMARKANLMTRIFAPLKLGITRQTSLGQLGLIVGMALSRV